MSESKTVTFNASDGESLAGHVFEPEHPSAAVLLAGATAVPQGFYRHFAGWLAGQGFATLTFDYRGIGESLADRHVRDVQADLVDWGSRDIPGALDWLAARYPGLPCHLIGHSAGGQMLGLMPNHSSLQRVVTVAASSGYVPQERGKTRWMARFIFQLYGPLSAHALGYLPARRLGLGEDLPAGVTRQWARWCLSPGYVANGIGVDFHEHWHDQVKGPVLALSGTDDPIATEPNVADLWRLFPNAAVISQRLVPSDYGLGEIGHMGFFRRSHRVLWPLAVAGLTVST